MFQAMTGDNWSEHARELMADTGGSGVYVALFYVSFMLIVSLVLVNVVIAVLLDEFGKASAAESHQNISAFTETDGESCVWSRLAQDLIPKGDVRDIERAINKLFDQIRHKSMVSASKPRIRGHDGQPLSLHDHKLLDRFLLNWRHGGIESWTLTFDEFARGLKSLSKYMPPVILSEREWHDHIVSQCLGMRRHPQQPLCIGRHGFMGVMKTAIRRHQMRCINSAMQRRPLNVDTVSLGNILMGTGALLRENQFAAAQRPSTRISRRFLKTLMAPSQKSTDTTDPVNLVMSTLLSSMHQMESRIATLEDSFRARLDKPPHTTERERERERDATRRSRARSKL